MKALSAVLASLALSAAAHAGAPHDEQAQAKEAGMPAATLVADAGRVGTAGLPGWQRGPWSGGTGISPADIDENGAPADLGLTTSAGAANLALITLGALALILPRPLARALRRREQQRRAAALASALGQTPNP